MWEDFEEYKIHLPFLTGPLQSRLFMGKDGSRGDGLDQRGNNADGDSDGSGGR